MKNDRAINLTGNGAREEIVYERTDFGGLKPVMASLEDGWVDLREPLYFTTRDLRIGQEGVVLRSESAEVSRLTVWRDERFMVFKAVAGNRILGLKISATQPPDYYVLDRRLRPTARLTHIDPQNRRFSAGARYLTFKTARGDTQHAVLRLPAQYRDGQRYPTIVMIYEEMWSGPNQFVGPGDMQFPWLRQFFDHFLKGEPAPKWWSPASTDR